MVETRRHFLMKSHLATALGMTALPDIRPEQAVTGGAIHDVTNYGAAGDGRTLCASAFQAAIDATEAEGGGTVRIPPGRFLLEYTPLIASRVHVIGSGAATVLRGVRPDNHRGAALISNKGQQARRYEGAHDWSISHLAIDSPDTNGIVITHADRVYLGFIHGVEVYHHFVDTVGRDILCENLFLTGRSGTSTFQVDSIHSAQTIWDGDNDVPPLRDDTDTENLMLRNSIITADAGHTGSRPQHHASIHFHGNDARGFIFSDLIVGGAETAFYQDENTRYSDVVLSNVICRNPGRALWFNPGRNDQQRLTVRGLHHAPERARDADPSYRGLEIHGRVGLVLSDIQLAAAAYAQTEFAVQIAASRQVRISGLQASGQGGYGILLNDGPTEDRAPMEQSLIQGALLEGFDVGCSYQGAQGKGISASGNLFTDVATPYQGDIRHD